MEFELIELTGLSGKMMKIYSFLPIGQDQTLYERFTVENCEAYYEEIVDIDTRLQLIGNKTGLRKEFYRDKEGVPGDGVCTLFDLPDKDLRLYFIEFGKICIILGGGGIKSKNMHAFQESEKLTEENYLLRALSLEVSKAIQDKKLFLRDDGFELADDNGLIFSVK